MPEKAKKISDILKQNYPMKSRLFTLGLSWDNFMAQKLKVPGKCWEPKPCTESYTE